MYRQFNIYIYIFKWRLQGRNKNNHSICNSKGYMLVQKAQTLSFIYLCQDKIMYINIYIHVKQDFNIRIKIYLHVSRSACEYIKSNKYWSTSSDTDRKWNIIIIEVHALHHLSIEIFTHTESFARTSRRSSVRFCKVPCSYVSFVFSLSFFFLLNYTNGQCWNCCLQHVCNEKCWHSQYNNHPWITLYEKTLNIILECFA